MLVTVLRELRIFSIVPGKGDVETYSEIELRMEVVRASIWFASTAGEGGRGTERAIARARDGVRVARAVERELSLREGIISHALDWSAQQCALMYVNAPGARTGLTLNRRRRA